MWRKKIILIDFICCQPCPQAAFGRLLGALPGIFIPAPGVFIPEPGKVIPEPDKADKLPKDPLGE